MLVEEEQGNNLASAEELEEERRIMNHPLFKNMMKKFDRSLQQVQQAAVEAVQKATSVSQQPVQGPPSGQLPQESGNNKNSGRGQIKMAHRIKSPSDTTIYVPALVKQNVNLQKSLIEVPMTATTTAMNRQGDNLDEDSLIQHDLRFIHQEGEVAVQLQLAQMNVGDHLSQVHAISNFV